MTAEMYFYIIFSSGGTSEKCPVGKEHSTLQRTVLKGMEMLETSLLKTQRIFKFRYFSIFRQSPKRGIRMLTQAKIPVTKLIHIKNSASNNYILFSNDSRTRYCPNWTYLQFIYHVSSKFELFPFIFFFLH